MQKNKIKLKDTWLKQTVLQRSDKHPTRLFYKSKKIIGFITLVLGGLQERSKRGWYNGEFGKATEERRRKTETKRITRNKRKS